MRQTLLRSSVVVCLVAVCAAAAVLTGGQAYAQGVLVYVTADLTDKGHVIDTRTNTLVQIVDTGINPGTLTDDPFGVTISPDGSRVYVANFGSDTVSVFSADATIGQLTALTNITAGNGTRDVVVTCFSRATRSIPSA